MADTKKPEAILAGERIKRARSIAGLSRADLAQKATIEVSTLGNYEQGLRTIGIPEAQRIEKATGIPAAFVMGLIDEEEMRLLRAHRQLHREEGRGPGVPKSSGSPFPSATNRATRTRAARR